MNILLVEDGEYKSERVVEFIQERFKNSTVDLCRSYSSAIKNMIKNDYDLTILDMSLPTFDNNGQSGGEFRAYGGLDIARQIKRRKINVNFLFLTQYKSFTDNPALGGLEDIDKIAKEEYKDKYLGCIFYEHAGFEWKDELGEVIKRYE